MSAIFVEQNTGRTTWPDGETRYCVRCGIDGTRRKPAVLTGFWKNGGFRLPVGYCTEHIPDELKEKT